jgi:galactokinase
MTDFMTGEKAERAFEERYGEPAMWLVRAPGRVNLIGEHTDYNDGYVFPMAINRAMWIALGPRSDDRVILYSLDFDEKLEVVLGDLQPGQARWCEYVKGMLWALVEEGLPPKGWQGVVTGDIPIGSGLSSSAALGIAIARACGIASQHEWQPVRMAKLAQKAENEWIGVNVGIMDPLISAVAKQGKATLIDCRSLAIEHIRLPSELTVVVMNTMKSRGLVDSAYNERRRECEQAAAHFGVTALRDVRLDQLFGAKGEMNPIVFKRAHHVISENGRTLEMGERLRNQDFNALSELIRASHTSLRDDFEVSCRKLDLIVEAANRHPGCVGARMTGAGFGGCAVALVRADEVDDFSAQVSGDYRRDTGIEPELLISDPAQGAAAESLT